MMSMESVQLKSKIGELRGIGPKKEKIFNDSGIFTIEDFIFLREYPII